VELVFFRAQGRADLGQINDGGRVLPCTGAEQWIFDSFGFEFATRHGRPLGLFGYGVMNPTSGFRNVVEQSQQKLNCALFVDFL